MLTALRQYCTLQSRVLSPSSSVFRDNSELKLFGALALVLGNSIGNKSDAATIAKTSIDTAPKLSRAFFRLVHPSSVMKIMGATTYKRMVIEYCASHRHQNCRASRMTRLISLMVFAHFPLLCEDCSVFPPVILSAAKNLERSDRR